MRNFPVVAFVGQLTAAYNFGSISIAVDILKREGFSVPSWAEDSLDAGIYGGAILGMWLMGYLGDRIGHSRAMFLTLCLSMVGSGASGLLAYGGESWTYALISAFRFICGFGIGGTFPLGARMAKDRARNQGVAARRVNIGWANFGQTWGFMLPYVLVYFLWLGDTAFEAEWRCCLATGAVFAIFVIHDAWSTKESDAFEKRQAIMKDESMETLSERICRPRLLWKLVGTGGSWFLFDFVCYGVKILGPTIVEDVFGSESETLGAVCWQNILLNALGLPAMVLTIFLIPVFGTKPLIIFSMMVQCMLFATFGLIKYYDPSNSWGLFSVLSGLYFFQSFGAGMGNFIMALDMFPEDVQSTFAGISAALGKLGAVTGIVIFDHTLTMHHGSAITMFISSCVCIACVVISAIFLESHSEADGDDSAKPELSNLTAEVEEQPYSRS